MVDFALTLLLAYAAVLGYVWFSQESLLYLPALLSAEAAARTAETRRLTPVQGGGFVRAPESGAIRGTVVVFHGNAGHAIDRDYYADALVPLGFRVVLAEYPGYGAKPGRSNEAALAADAVATLSRLRTAYPGPLIAWGESLGAGVLGSALAQQPDLVDGLVLLTPWDSLAAVAGHHYWYLPVRMLLRDRYETAVNLKDFSGPTAVAISAEDRVIPAPHGQRLHAALNGRKTLHVFAGADHNSWPSDPSERWWREIMDFVTARR